MDRRRGVASLVLGLVSLFLPSEGFATERRLSFAAALAAADGHALVTSTAAGERTLADAAQTVPSVDANPTVTVSGGARITADGQAGWEGGVVLNQSLSVVGSAKRSREALLAEASWLRSEKDARKLERRVAVATAWLDLHEAERRVEEQRAELALDERVVALVGRLAAAGERTAADLAVAEVQLATTRVRAVAAEASVVEARAALDAEIGAKALLAGATIVTDGPLPEVEVPSVPQRLGLLQRASELPNVTAKALLARSEWARAEEDSATSAARLSVGAEVRREDFGSVVALANVGVPMPIFDLGLRSRAARRAEAERLDGQRDEELARARTALSLAIHEVEHTAELREVLATRLCPAADRALALRTRQLELGTTTLLEVLDARRGSLAARLERIAAEHGEIRARIRLALMAKSLREVR